jgi:hypothetical protein
MRGKNTVVDHPSAAPASVAGLVGDAAAAVEAEVAKAAAMAAASLKGKNILNGIDLVAAECLRCDVDMDLVLGCEKENNQALDEKWDRGAGERREPNKGTTVAKPLTSRYCRKRVKVRCGRGGRGC